jgi:hypothetical protein
MEFLKKSFDSIEMHNICCRHDPCVKEKSVIINVCPGCDRRFSNLYEGISAISLWEILIKIESFPYPDYSKTKMSIQDACPVKNKPQVHLAIRSLLSKMNIDIVENINCGEKSICCGDSYYPALPLEQIHEKMKKRAGEMPCGDVVVYCVSCIKSMYIGQKNPRHMIDLLFNEVTTPEVYDTLEWHNQIQSYIDAH